MPGCGNHHIDRQIYWYNISYCVRLSVERSQQTFTSLLCYKIIHVFIHHIIHIYSLYLYYMLNTGIMNATSLFSYIRGGWLSGYRYVTVAMFSYTRIQFVGYLIGATTWLTYTIHDTQFEFHACSTGL